MAYLHIIRHGESLANEDQDIYNSIPNHAVPLTEKGTIQACSRGKHLQSIIDDDDNVKIWTSPYKRTQDTTANIVEQFTRRNIPICEEPLLAEINYGLFDGIPVNKRFDEFPKETRRYQFECKEQGKFWAKYPRGESAFNVDVRLIPVIQEIKEFLKDEDNHAIVVSHATTSRVLIRRLLGLTYKDYHHLESPDNADIITLEIKNGICNYKI